MIYPIEELDPVDAAKFRHDVAVCWSRINERVDLDAATQLSMKIYDLIVETEAKSTVILALANVLLTIANDCPAPPAVLMAAVSLAVVHAHDEGLGETLQ